MHWFYHVIRHALVHWGYWAVLAGLIGEDAGLPVPGETILIFASFLSHKHTGLRLQWVIAVGIGACITGDNLGFLLGHRLGSRLIRWARKIFRLTTEDVGAAKDQIRRHGAATIFWARYIFGLRTVAGPLAGVLGMDWRKFLLYNALGAATWVTSIAMIGFAFANQFNTLLGYLEDAAWAMAAGIFTLGYLLWRKQKKRFKERQRAEQTT